MKKLTIITLTLLLSVSVFAGSCDEECTDTTGSQLDSMASTMARGFANVLTFWVEVPRCVWSESEETPLLGTFTGLLDGTLLGTTRALSGVVDIASLGLTPQSVYSDSFPKFVWNAPWDLEDDEDCE